MITTASPDPLDPPPNTDGVATARSRPWSPPDPRATFRGSWHELWERGRFLGMFPSLGELEAWVARHPGREFTLVLRGFTSDERALPATRLTIFARPGGKGGCDFRLRPTD